MSQPPSHLPSHQPAPPSANPFHDPDMPIVEVMRRWPQTISVFLEHGMLCVGCQVGPFHTVDDACREYRLDPDRFRDALWAAIGRSAAP